MTKTKSQQLRILLFVVFLIAVTVFSIDISKAYSNTLLLDPTPEVSSTDLEAEKTQIDEPESGVSNLQGSEEILKVKLEDSPKDIWDIVAIISGLATGVAVALIGGIAAFIYRERKRISDEMQDRRATSVQRVQTSQSFMPDLQSSDPRVVEAALLSIAIIDANQAIVLAQVFKGQGATAALTRLAQDNDASVATKAKAALDQSSDTSSELKQQQ